MYHTLYHKLYGGFEYVINLGLYPAVWGSSRAISAVEAPMGPHGAPMRPPWGPMGGCAVHGTATSRERDGCTCSCQRVNESEKVEFTTHK